MEDHKFIFNYSNGYVIRNLFDIFKKFLSNITLVFNDKGLKISETTKDNKICFEAFVNKNYIDKYCVQGKEHKVTLSTSELSSKISLIAKKGELNLYQINDRDIYLGTNDGVVLIETIINESIEHNQILNYNNSPNIKVKISDFSRMCKQMKKVGSNNIVIKCYEDGISFRGVNLKGNENCHIQYGDCDEDDDKENTFTLTITEISNLTKINNLSPLSLMGFYYKKQLPLKITSCIGYGDNQLNIYIRNDY